MYEDKGDGKEIADYIKIVALDIVPEIFTAITIKTRDQTCNKNGWALQIDLQ